MMMHDVMPSYKQDNDVTSFAWFPLSSQTPTSKVGISYHTMLMSIFRLRLLKIFTSTSTSIPSSTFKGNNTFQPSTHPSSASQSHSGTLCMHASQDATSLSFPQPQRYLPALLLAQAVCSFLHLLPSCFLLFVSSDFLPLYYHVHSRFQLSFQLPCRHISSRQRQQMYWSKYLRVVKKPREKWRHSN